MGGADRFRQDSLVVKELPDELALRLPPKKKRDKRPAIL